MRSCARYSSAPTTGRSPPSMTSSAATSWSACPKATSRLPVIPRTPCADEGLENHAACAEFRLSWQKNWNRHCERSEAIQLLQRKLDCFVTSLLAMTINGEEYDGGFSS